MEKRTLAEIRSRHDLEPSLKDVYVEGQFDRDVLDQHSDQNGRGRYVFYEADGIEISDEIFAKYGLTSGNKQRVISIAKELADLNKSEFRCLVDRDLDHWFGTLEAVPRLIWTDHTSLDMYFYRDDLLNLLTVVTARLPILQFETFKLSLETVCRELYAMRLADRSLSFNFSWTSLKKYLSFKADLYAFEQDKYVTALLMSNRRIREKQKYLDEINRWKILLAGDPRSHIRGHDLLELLALAIRDGGGYSSFAAEEPLRRLLVSFSDRVQEFSNIF